MGGGWQDISLSAKKLKENICEVLKRMLQTMSVGELLIPGKKAYPEGMMLEYTTSGPIVILSFGNPTDKEIEGAKNGQIEMAYYETEQILFLVTKIAGCGGWLDAPFNIRIYDDKNIEFDWSEEIVDGSGLAMQIVLVDANTGIIKAMRLIGTHTKFAKGFRAAILRQFEKTFERNRYMSTLNEIYARLSSDDMAKRAEHYFKIKRD